MSASGPAVQRCLNLFCEKLAMASFAHYCARPIGMEGILYTQWFLNAGMPTQIYDACLRIMPSFDQLRQGQKTSSGQFELRYNTDGKGLVALISSIQSSLAIVALSTDDQSYVELMKGSFADLRDAEHPTSQLVRPGLLKLKANATSSEI